MILKEKNNPHLIYYIVITIMLIAIAGVIVTDVSITRRESKNITTKLNEEKEKQSEYFFSVDTEVSFIRKYSLSGEENIVTSSLPSELFGKGIGEIARTYQDWTLKSYTEKEIVFEKQISSYGKGYYRITSVPSKMGEEVVGVYSYDIDGKEILSAVTSFPLSLLEDSQQLKIKKGVVIFGKEELKKYMQNYEE